MCKFSLKASVQKFVRNVFAKIVQSAFFSSRLFKELYNVEIQFSKEGLKIYLSRVKVK